LEKNLRGADLLIQALSVAGVKTIYALSGNQIMPLFDACIDANIRLIHTRHEGAAVFMAQAHAQLTGEIGVALVTAGPGFTNALGPLMSSIKSESPVLLLSGDSATNQDGRGAFQEIDQVAISKGLTKHAERVMDGQDLGNAAARAISQALSACQGPVHLALPADVLLADVGDTALPARQHFEPSVPMLELSQVAQVSAAIASASKPLIVLGPSFSAGTRADLREQLEQALTVPVLIMESPRGLNDPSLGAFAACAKQADLIVSIGKSMDFTTGFGDLLGPEASLIMICASPEPIEQARNAVGKRITLGLVADPATAARQLAGNTSERSGHWLATMKQNMAARSWTLDNLPGVNNAAAKTSDGLHPAALCAAIQPVLDSFEDPILIIDGGEFGQWAQACLNAPVRLINGPSGAIGGGLCYAVAAKAVRPNAQIVVLMGDGTVGFHLGELETAHRLGLAFTVIIGHDASWNAEVQIQKREFGEDRQIACELNPTRYDQVAIALGCEAEHVTDATSLKKAMTVAATRSVPTCLNVPIQPNAAPAAPALVSAP